MNSLIIACNYTSGINGQYRARQAHHISMPMQITRFGGRIFERVEYSKHSIL